ncbi:ISOPRENYLCYSTEINE ALPHA-CARBONYL METHYLESTERASE ICMEL1-RELATED, partial [Salix purpurea]
MNKPLCQIPTALPVSLSFPSQQTSQDSAQPSPELLSVFLVKRFQRGDIANDHPFKGDPITSTRLESSPFEDETIISVRPLLSRTPSFAGTTTTSSASYQQRRRRVASENSLPSLSDDSFGQRPSPAREVDHAASETFLLTRLSLKLLRYMGVGYRWIVRFLALGCYSLMLFPGFIQVGYHYFFSSRVLRSIVYGDQPRNRLDLYLPKNTDGPKPVVAFVTGGAWIIGYKAWGSLLGQQLSERDIMVACIDY